MTRRRAILTPALFGLAVLASLFSVPRVHAAETVRVAAAISLKEALDEAANAFSATGGSAIVVSYGASSSLARQIDSGAPFDLFISASTDWMDWLARREGIVVESRADLVGNALVVVAAETQAKPLRSLADLPARLGRDRLAVGQRRAVPAGLYAMQALRAAGVADALRDRLAEGDNVRTALALVARGETPYGIVYETDARAEPRVTTVLAIPSTLHERIVYPAAVTATGRRSGAGTFLAFLRSAPGQAMLRRHGFRALGGSDG